MAKPGKAPDTGSQGLPAVAPASAAPAQPRNPLHGVTLEQMVTALAARYGWPGLADYLPTVDGTIAARLKAAGGTGDSRRGTQAANGSRL